MKSENDAVRYMLLKSAYQNSFDLSYSFSDMNLGNPVQVNESFRFIFNNGDDFLRAGLEIMVAIEKFRAMLKNTKRDFLLSYSMLSLDSLLQRWESGNRNLDVVVAQVSDFGKLFIEIVTSVMALCRAFPNYKLNPRFYFFLSKHCGYFYNHYYTLFVFTSLTLNYADVNGFKDIPLLLENAKNKAKITNDLFQELVSEFCSKELSVSADNFEKKAIANFIDFNNFFLALKRNDDTFKVVIKAIFYFPTQMESKETTVNADKFNALINDFNASMRKSTKLKGLVKITSVIRVYSSIPWRIESYITLAFPIDGYPFDYNRGSLSLWLEHDGHFLSAINNNPLLASKNNMSELAKDINSFTDDGKDIEKIINDMRKAELSGVKCELLSGSHDYSSVFGFRKKQVIFDSFVFVGEMQNRWRNYLKKAMGNKSAVVGYEDVRLQSMLLIHEKVEQVVHAPEVFNNTGYIPRGSNLDSGLYSYKDGLKVKIGLSASSNPLGDIMRTAMASMFFMTLDLSGRENKFDEVRNVFSVNAKKRDAKYKTNETSISLSRVTQILKVIESMDNK